MIQIKSSTGGNVSTKLEMWGVGRGNMAPVPFAYVTVTDKDCTCEGVKDKAPKQMSHSGFESRSQVSKLANTSCNKKQKQC